MGEVVVPLVSKPEGWDPRAPEVRYCPIHCRPVWVKEACPRWCGPQYVTECKFADHDPTRDEMQVTIAKPIFVAEGVTAQWAQKWRQEHSPVLPKGGLKIK